MEDKKNKKFTKKLAAIIALAFGGAVIGSGILAPFFIFKNWKEIQYDVIDIEQNFSKTTDTSVAFDFAFSDEQTYRLNGTPIKVSILDANKNVVQSGDARYVESLRKWSFDSTGFENKLLAGRKYEISFETDSKSITKEKKKFNVLNENKKTVVTKANVSQFETSSLNSREQQVTVKFADEIKSLDGKKAILKYHYTTVSQGNAPDNPSDIKNDETRISFDQAVEIKDGKAQFVIKGLQPARKYVIEYVAIVDENEYNGIVSQREIAVPYDVEAKSTFETKPVKLEVNNVQTIKMGTNTGQISVGFLKSNDEPEISLVGKSTKLKYKIKGTSEIKEISSTVIGNSSIFDFNAKDAASTLQEGTEYEIVSIEAADSSVEFKDTLSAPDSKALFFSTQEAVSAITFGPREPKQKTFTIDIISQENKGNLDGASIEVSLEPFNDKAIQKQVLTKKEGTADVYTATFTATDLLQGITYKIAKVKITPKNNPEDSFNLPFNNAIDQDENLRSFTTVVGQADLHIQGFAKAGHNSATVNLVYDPENNFLSGKTLILTYKKINPASEQEYTVEAVANALKATFELGGNSTVINKNTDDALATPAPAAEPLDAGTTYKLLSVRLKDTTDIETVLKADDERQKEFTTNSRIRRIESLNITDTSATIKVTFADAIKTITTTEAEDGTKSPSHRKAKLIYQVNNSKEGQETLQSSPKSTELVDITEDGATFNITGLLKGVEYQITGIQFDIELPTFYGSEVSSRADNSFTTTAKQFDVQNIRFENESETSADILLSFDLNSDIILINKKVDVYFKEADDANATEQKVTTTIDELGVANAHATNLAEGKKYIVTKLLPHIEPEAGNEALQEADYRFVIPSTLDSKKTFYTKPAVSLITRTNLTENSATFDLSFVNADPAYLKAQGKIKVAYTNADGVSAFVEQDLTLEQFNSKKVIVTLNNLEKVTSYTLDKISINGIEVPRVTSFDQETNKFTTPSTTSKVISLNQITNGDNDVTFELAFDNVIDKFMDTKEVNVTLTKDNSTQTVVARGTVQSGILRIHAETLEAGTKYNITNFALADASSEPISIAFADSVQVDKRFVYTRPLVNSFNFNDVAERTATVVVHFADSQNNYNGKNVIFSILNKTTNAVSEINSTTLSSGQTIENNQISIALSNLDKFTEYEVVGVKVNVLNSNFEDITIKTGIAKTFNTTATNVAVSRITVEDVTKKSATVSYVFDNIDAYLNERQVTLHYTVQDGSEQTATATVKNTLGTIHADFELTNLEEGSQYNASRITIDNIANITNDSTTFYTLGVVQNVVATTVHQQDATITVTFKNADTNKTFNNKQALIKFASAANGTLKTATATVTNNSATFTLNSLDKNTKYILQDVSLEESANDYRIIELDKSFTTENQTERIRDFTTSATSATVISIIEDANSKTKSSTSVTFQFDRVVDAFLADKSATLTYINKKDGSTNQTSSATTVNSATNSLTFNLDNLEEGAGFSVVSINIDGVSVDFKTNVNKDFSTLPVVSAITSTVPTTNDSDTQIGLTLTFGDGLHSLNGKRANVSISSATNGSQTLYTSDATITNNSVSFNLTNLDKNNQFVIDEVIVDGTTIEFNSTINDSNNASRRFKTTAKQARTTSLQTIEASKDSVLLSLNFDINKDWYLVNKQAKLKFTKGSEEFETTAATINDEGSLIINVNAQTLINSKILSSGTGYTLTEVIISENNDTNTTISLEDLSDKIFSTLSTINAISAITTTENSASFTMTLQTQDTSLVNKRAFVHIVNNSTNAITTVESTANFNDQHQVTFNVTGLPKNDTYTILGLSIGSSTAQILEYETTVQESAKTFRTQPTTATVTGISYKWLDANKSKAQVTLSFDSDVDSFMNGKALKLKYYKVQPDNGVHVRDDAITVAKQDGQDIIVRGSTIKFILQGRIDANGNQINNTSSYSSNIQTATGDGTEPRSAAFKGLIQGAKYRIESLQTVDTNENITISFANNLTPEMKDLLTPDGVIGYNVGLSAAEGNVVEENGARVTVKASVSSLKDLVAINAANPGNRLQNIPGAIKLKIYNIATGKYEEMGVNKVVFRDYNTFWIEFQGLLSKESRYQIVSILIDGVPTVNSPTGYNLADGSRFNSNSDYATVTNIEYGEKTTTSAKMSISFAKADENLLRNRKRITVSYRKRGTNDTPTTIQGQIDANTKKLELNITGLEPGAEYEITAVRIEEVSISISNQPFPAFTLTENQYKPNVVRTFSTTPVIDLITKGTIDQTTAVVTIRLKGDVSDIADNSAGTIVLSKGAPDSTDFSAYNTAQNVFFDKTNKTIRFDLSNLDKDTQYNVRSLTIGDNIYSWDNNITVENRQFSTSGTTATITNIAYSNIINTEARITATIATIDSYVNTRNLKVVYQELDDSNNLVGQPLLSSDVIIENNNAVFNLSNLKNGKKYRVIRFENTVPSSDSAHQSVGFNIDNGVNTEFASYVGIKTVANTTQEESATLTVTLKDYEPTRVIGKLAILRLQGIDQDIYATVDSNQVATFVIRNLAKETTYTIDTIKIDNNTLNYYESVTEQNKQFTTLGNTATITSISNANNTTNRVDVTLTFAAKDKYLNNKQVKLYYKEAEDTTSATAKTNATAATVTLNGQIATVTFALDSNDVQSGKKYEILGLKSQPDENAITFSISNSINISAHETKFFETKIARPVITGAQITSTDNPEGKNNTFLSHVSVTFSDPNDALNTNLINSWNFQLKNSKSGSEQIVSDLQFINRSYTRDNSTNTTTLTFDIKGDILKWVGRVNKLEIDFSYFDNLEKTHSISGTFINEKTINNTTSTIDLETQERYVTTSLSGVVTTGYDIEFNLKVYDPKQTLTNFGSATGAYNYAPSDNRREFLSPNGLTNEQPTTTGNALSFILRAKQSFINFTGQAWAGLSRNNFYYNSGLEQDRSTTEEQNQWWAIASYGTTRPAGLNTPYPDGDLPNRNYLNNNNLPPLDKWKFRAEGRDWTNVTKAFKKEILWINRETTGENADMVDIKIRITAGGTRNEASRDYLIAKIFNFDLNDFKIQNEKTLFASKSSTVWENYQSPLLTGSGTSFIGTADGSSNFWDLNFGPTIFNSNTGVYDKGKISLNRVEYNENTGKLKAIIDLPNTTPPTGGLNTDTNNGKGFIAYALFVNSKGDEYVFGDKNGQGLDFLRNITYRPSADGTNQYDTAEIEFDLKNTTIPLSQLPEENETLRFVNVIFSRNGYGTFLYPMNWTEVDNSYKEIQFKR
ncbi:hypothetical protein ACR34G_02875 [Mycoplasma sp. 480]|uniref:hypothetical protein n=1 Tax=Mycoplasma sp. 480 TaxID=3440155 RepID=UPI003F515D7E